MSENEKTAETSAENTAQGGVNAGAAEKETSEATFVAETARDKNEGKEKDDHDGKQSAKNAVNAENARRRREEERQREVKKARESAIIEALDGKNPYTGEAMKDSFDVEEYLTMRRIAKEGGDPVNDYPKYAKNSAREAAEKQVSETERKEWYDRDREDFAAKHPDADLEALISDEHFRRFAEGKVGNVPLSEIYEGYISFTDELRKTAVRNAAQQLANAKATPGALSGSAPEPDFFTKDQVKAMSKEEVHKNYDKIVKSMEKWE